MTEEGNHAILNLLRDSYPLKFDIITFGWSVGIFRGHR